MTLNNKFYFMAPVEVVRVTPKNLAEVAEWCGGKVARVESRKVKGRVDSYVWVPTPKGAPISWAFPGMFITKRLAVTEKNELKATYSVFRKDYFSKNYFEEMSHAVDQTWERQVRETRSKAVVKPITEAVDALTITVMPTSSPEEIARQISQILSVTAPKGEMVAQREGLREELVELNAGPDLSTDEKMTSDQLPHIHEQVIALSTKVDLDRNAQ